jgi:hypothetical protein
MPFELAIMRSIATTRFEISITKDRAEVTKNTELGTDKLSARGVDCYFPG